MPIIVSRTKIDDYYFNETIVRFFEPHNIDDLYFAMLEMIRNKEIRENLSEKALEFVQSYLWKNTKQKYLCLVDSVTER